MRWTSSSGEIELNLTKAQARMCAHPGDCESDVKFLLLWGKAIKRQVKRLDPGVLAKVLKEYGAWSETELLDHAQNVRRLMWIAAGDISDGR